MSPEQDARLRAAASTASRRPSGLVTAALAAYLHRVTGATDLVLGLPVTARSGPAMRAQAGMLANILPLRVRPRPDTTVGALIDEVSRELQKATLRQRYRGEDLCRDLRIPGGILGLIGPSVNYMAFDYRLRFAGASATAEAIAAGPVDDLAVAAYDRGDGSRLVLDVEANTARYRADEVDAHLDRLVRVLDALCDPAGQDRPLASLDLLTPDERALALGARAGTAGTPGAHTLPAGFEAQVDRTPDAVAVVDGDRSLTYRALDERADRLAHVLAARGVGRGDVVALALPRTAEAVVAVLAVHKAGAAHLAIDPDHPAPRVAAMLADAGPALVVATAGLAALAGPAPAAPDTLVLDDPRVADELAAAPPGRLGPGHAPTLDDAAYVIYTSGSTGRPKGVVVPHEGIAQPRRAPRSRASASGRPAGCCSSRRSAST